MGQASVDAAIASVCANEQDMFWPYHDIIFANQTGAANQYSQPRLVAFAETLEMDTAEFERCTRSNQALSMVSGDLAQGQTIGVNSTPAVFINGERVDNPTFETISAIVQQKLAELGS